MDDLTEIGQMYFEMDAIIQSIYDQFDRKLMDKSSMGTAHALVMALERINNEVGRRTNAI